MYKPAKKRQWTRIFYDNLKNVLPYLFWQAGTQNPLFHSTSWYSRILTPLFVISFALFLPFPVQIPRKIIHVYKHYMYVWMYVRLPLTLFALVSVHPRSARLWFRSPMVCSPFFNTGWFKVDIIVFWTF